jgi:2,4-dienoyl-CoA reductase-like NADH-dependent reductase (Old Yellow Enzyme family)
VGIQLAHAGRKASCVAPWRGGTSIDDSEGGWQKVAPSAVAFEGYHEPRELTIAEIQEVIEAFAAAARRAVAAGFDVIEIHSAHGYLLHEFLSPISNKRTDEYGGSFENRIRLLCEVASAVRLEVPQNRALFVRLSATDWVEGGWDVEQSCAVVRELHARGVEFIDVSSGGLSMAQDIKLGPGYQVDFARTIAQETGMPVSAVGMITTGAQAEDVLADGTVEAVMIGRSTLGNSRWPYQAAKELGDDIPWPDQYARGFLAR